MADPEPETAPKNQSAAASGGNAPSDPPKNDVKAQKMARLQAYIDSLDAEIKTKSEKLEAVKAELKSPPAQTVKTHITLLHEYNEIRDIGQGLLGMVAEQRSCRVADLYAGEGEERGEFGVGVRD